MRWVERTEKHAGANDGLAALNPSYEDLGPVLPQFPRKQEFSVVAPKSWIPAFAGMT